jgi:hypothetical protein
VSPVELRGSLAGARAILLCGHWQTVLVAQPSTLNLSLKPETLSLLKRLTQGLSLVAAVASTHIPRARPSAALAASSRRARQPREAIPGQAAPGPEASLAGAFRHSPGGEAVTNVDVVSTLVCSVPGIGRGLHSLTSQLNLSVCYGIGGALKGCVAHVKGVLGGV